LSIHKRFTESRVGRSKIPRAIRERVFSRDGFKCQYCGQAFPADRLTIDHLIPLAMDGPDEITNYVSACEPCNARKGHLPLHEFAATLQLDPKALPIHGDPILDNESLPYQIRLIRRRVFDRIREGTLSARGKSAQKKIEKAHRMSLWETDIGKKLESEVPSLPGQVRVMVPEIRTIAKSEGEYLLLVELAKSASTRNLIGSVLTNDADVLARLRAKRSASTDPALNKRIDDALNRWRKELLKRGDAGGHVNGHL
jgi:hypothetical protein